MTAIQAADVTEMGGSHSVRLYELEADLFVEVALFACRAIEAGDTAIVVATADHHDGFRIEIERRGLTVEAARQSGRLVMVDAGMLLSRFVQEDHIDRDAFHSVVGSLVRQQATTGRGVQIFGEMVSLLWESGQILAAIELESLWNELGRMVPFTLLCAYRVDGGAATAENALALGQVCALHSVVLEGSTSDDREDRMMRGAEVRAQFPAHVEAPRAARHFVVDAMRRWGFVRDLLDDAALVATELAANAVVHASSAFTVVVSADDEVVRIAVEDAVPVDRTLLVVRPGRGLGLIDGLSSRWGADVATDRKIIWAELGVGRLEPPSGYGVLPSGV